MAFTFAEVSDIDHLNVHRLTLCHEREIGAEIPDAVLYPWEVTRTNACPPQRALWIDPSQACAFARAPIVVCDGDRAHPEAKHLLVLRNLELAAPSVGQNIREHEHANGWQNDE
jgi:hypothetical protein